MNENTDHGCSYHQFNLNYKATITSYNGISIVLRLGRFVIKAKVNSHVMWRGDALIFMKHILASIMVPDFARKTTHTKSCNDVTMHQQQRQSTMKAIEKEERRENESLFVFIVWITMIYCGVHYAIS
eukprot:523267_1